MSNQINIPGHMHKFETIQGGKCFRFKFDSQDLGIIKNEMLALLIGLENKIGWFSFFPDGEKQHHEPEFEIPDAPASTGDKKEKSKAAKLRAVLFLYWKQLGEKGEFQDFYDARMDTLIDKVREKLES